MAKTSLIARKKQTPPQNPISEQAKKEEAVKVESPVEKPVEQKRAGRPPKEVEERRDKTVLVSITQSDYKDLRLVAFEDETTPAAYLYELYLKDKKRRSK